MARSNTFQLEIVAPTGMIFEGQADSVSIPVSEGAITILPHHTPLFTQLAEGEIEIRREGGKTENIVISGGFAEVKQDSVNILSDYAIRAESIQIAQAEEKKRQAESRIKQKLTNEEFTLVDKDLKLSILELKVAQKMRRKTRV